MSIDVSVRITASSGAPTFGRAHDVSSMGMSLYAAVELAIGDQIRVEFILPNSRLKLNIKAVIRNRIGFRYGIQFEDLTPAESTEMTRVAGILALTQS